MAKLGTQKRPVRFRVQTEERLQEIALLCDKNGWIFVGGFEPDEPEDLCEVEYLLNPQAFTSQPRMGNADNMTVVHEKPKVGRNEPCPCGSGKKYKKAEKIYKMPLGMDLEGEADLIDRLDELKTKREKNT